MLANLIETTNLGALLMLGALVLASAIMVEVTEKIKKILKKVLTNQ